MKNILLIGEGEVGSAIKQIEEDAGNEVHVQELDNEAPQLIYDVCYINICYNENFTKIVTDYLLKFKPELTIINSTVKPGTTNFLAKSLNMPIVHSPIRGIHPHLKTGIQTFIKYVGGKPNDVKLACEHLDSVHLISYYVGDAKQTEYGKILSTSYYGWNILFAKLIKEICDKENLDYDIVYTHFNNTYNVGYKKLEKENVIRPVLFAPEGEIKGHCVTQNWELLSNNTDLKWISKFLNNKNESIVSYIYEMLKSDVLKVVKK